MVLIWLIVQVLSVVVAWWLESVPLTRLFAAAQQAPGNQHAAANQHRDGERQERRGFGDRFGRVIVAVVIMIVATAVTIAVPVVIAITVAITATITVTVGVTTAPAAILIPAFAAVAIVVLIAATGEERCGEGDAGDFAGWTNPGAGGGRSERAERTRGETEPRSGRGRACAGEQRHKHRS